MIYLLFDFFPQVLLIACKRKSQHWPHQQLKSRLSHRPNVNTPYGLVVRFWHRCQLSKRCGSQNKNTTKADHQLFTENASKHKIHNITFFLSLSSLFTFFILYFCWIINEFAILETSKIELISLCFLFRLRPRSILNIFKRFTCLSWHKYWIVFFLSVQNLDLSTFADTTPQLIFMWFSRSPHFVVTHIVLCDHKKLKSFTGKTNLRCQLFEQNKNHSQIPSKYLKANACNFFYDFMDDKRIEMSLSFESSLIFGLWYTFDVDNALIIAKSTSNFLVYSFFRPEDIFHNILGNKICNK